MTHSLNARARFLPLLLAGLAIAIAGCATTFVGETPAQRAYELERAYNIVLENALDLADAQPSLRPAILRAEASPTPIIESLAKAFADYEVARAAFAAGESTGEQLAVVAASLESWISQAQAALLSVSRAREGPN